MEEIKSNNNGNVNWFLLLNNRQGNNRKNGAQWYLLSVGFLYYIFVRAIIVKTVHFYIGIINNSIYCQLVSFIT